VAECIVFADCDVDEIAFVDFAKFRNDVGRRAFGSLIKIWRGRGVCVIDLQEGDRTAVIQG
jgi:hypothetical protein